MNRNILILALILIVSFALRFYKLSEVPAGIHQDEVSQAYNAYSILKTGRDRYDKSFPILFRSFGSYQPPLYTYLSVVPVAVLGNTILSARLISALSGTLIVLLTYQIVISFGSSFKKEHFLALIASAVVAISPWAIVFSRMAVEANLGLAIFLLAVYLFICSLKNIRLLFPAFLFVGLSTHAYYSERIVSLIFLSIFMFSFRSYFLKHKKEVIFGVVVFLITQIPHLMILQSGAFSRRFDQVSYIGEGGGVFSAIGQLASHYLEYFSIKSLFTGSGGNLGRIIPGVGAFYIWMLLPALLGLLLLLKAKPSISKILVLLLLITPIPAALTGDVFYPLRALGFLWVVSVVIAIGVWKMISLVRIKSLRVILLILAFTYSLRLFYNPYFSLYKYETADNFGYPYFRLVESLTKYPDKPITVDSGRDYATAVRFAYFNELDPTEMQKILREKIFSTSYYSSEFDVNEANQIDNITVRPIVWGQDVYKDQIIIGDTLAISPRQVDEHKLKLEFEVVDFFGNPELRGYSTNPVAKCLVSLAPVCRDILY